MAASDTTVGTAPGAKCNESRSESHTIHGSLERVSWEIADKQVRTNATTQGRQLQGLDLVSSIKHRRLYPFSYHASTTISSPFQPEVDRSLINGGLSSSQHNPDFLDRTHACRLEIEDKLSALRRRLFDVTRREDEKGLRELHAIVVNVAGAEKG